MVQSLNECACADVTDRTAHAQYSRMAAVTERKAKARLAAHSIVERRLRRPAHPVLGPLRHKQYVYERPEWRAL